MTTRDRRVPGLLLLLGLFATWNGVAEAANFRELALGGRIYSAVSLASGAALVALAACTLAGRCRGATSRLVQTCLTGVLGLNQAYGLFTGATTCGDPG